MAPNSYRASRKLQELKNLSDFAFNFEVTDEAELWGNTNANRVHRAEDEIRFSANLAHYHPTKLIKVTISELDQLYVGSEKGKVNNEWSNQIIESQNHALCCSGMKKLSQSLMKYQMI